MPLPLAPIAGIALRYGAVAVATYAMTRRISIQRGHFDQRGESAMDDVSEGISLRREPEQVNGATRFRRVVRVGPDGPGLEIDITALGRIRFRKV
ncbi:MAG: hypothetical protein WBN04_20280 [Paracoccaceae bacterium]